MKRRDFLVLALSLSFLIMFSSIAKAKQFVPISLPISQVINSNNLDFIINKLQGCPANRGNSFTVTGRGGKPPLPNEPLRPNNTVLVDWVGDTQEQRNRKTETQRTISSPTNYPLPTTQENPEIVEATGWIINDKGQVILIASAPTTANGTPLSPTTCPTSVEAQ